MSSIFNSDYINKTYKDSNIDYPLKMAKYFIDVYNIPIGSKILDIGCGNGLVANAFTLLGMEVFGIDISESALENLDNNRFIKYNLQHKNYPINSEMFDYIFSKSVVEHLIEPDVLIDESYRLLKPNGTFFCLTPSWKHTCKEAFYIDHTHVTPFTKYSLNTICELSGFEAKTTYFYQLPVLWRNPVFSVFRWLIARLPITYSPFGRVFINTKINKIVRFSKEAMLLTVAIKK